MFALLATVALYLGAINVNNKTYYFGSGKLADAANVNFGNATRIFICVDSAEILLANVCDGTPDCPDSSDETGKLCRRIVCPKDMYRCAYGACIIRASRCNGLEDCIDGSDEFRCDDDSNNICSDREFQCSNTTQQECISFADTCNGYADCSDESDESPLVCRENFCPEHTFRCSYGGCIHQEVACDGIKDCIDGTDEDATVCASVNSQLHKCRQDEFSCGNERQCIPYNKICDGTRQCRDSSDEDPEMCKSRKCPKGWFRCSYGGCIRSELKCNLHPDCHDWSDEEELLCRLVLPDGACRLPGLKPNTHYTVSGCSHCHPGDVVPELTKLDYTCNIEATLDGSSTIYCQNNQWLPSVPNCPANSTSQDKISCPALSESLGTTKRCKAKWWPHKGWISCNQPIPIGTRIFFECPPFYERITGSSSIVCLHDGTWNQKPLSCKPMCGIRDSSAAALIVHGWEMTPEESLPWHASLFSLEDGEWILFCGGTLIAERIVLTAAHCVWKSVAETIQVVFQIKSRELKDMNVESQILDVESIELQDFYQDLEGNYGSDLAILILKKAVFINSFVHPACINWSSDVTLTNSQRNGQTGLVAGMGFTENDTLSTTMRITSLKIITDGACRQKLNPDFRKYLRYTSFCAGWANGTGVCNGDSGGGLVLQNPNTNLWELHGVVSVSPRKLGTNICDTKFYTIFTKVFVYTKWIRSFIDKIPVLGPPKDSFHPNRDQIIV